MLAELFGGTFNAGGDLLMALPGKGGGSGLAGVVLMPVGFGGADGDPFMDEPHVAYLCFFGVKPSAFSAPLALGDTTADASDDADAALELDATLTFREGVPGRDGNEPELDTAAAFFLGGGASTVDATGGDGVPAAPGLALGAVVAGAEAGGAAGEEVEAGGVGGAEAAEGDGDDCAKKARAAAIPAGAALPPLVAADEDAGASGGRPFIELLFPYENLELRELDADLLTNSLLGALDGGVDMDALAIRRPSCRGLVGGDAIEARKELAVGAEPTGTFGGGSGGRLTLALALAAAAA